MVGLKEATNASKKYPGQVSLVSKSLFRQCKFSGRSFAELDRYRRVMEDAGDVIANYTSKIQARVAEIWGEDQRDQPI